MSDDLMLANLQIDGDCLTESQRKPNPHARQKSRKSGNLAIAQPICLSVC